VLAQYGLAADAHLLNKRGPEWQATADEFSTPGSRGSLLDRWDRQPRQLRSRSVTFEGLLEATTRTRRGLWKWSRSAAGGDFSGHAEYQAAILAIHRLRERSGAPPFIVSVTIEPMGTMLAVRPSKRCGIVRHAKPLAFGITAQRPEFMTAIYAL